MTVHLAGNLPGDDYNGLTAMERALVGGYMAGDKHLVIGRVRVTGTKRLEKEGWRDNPIVTFEQIELVPDDMADAAARILVDAYGQRTGSSTLDFPDDETGTEPMVQPPLQLEMSHGDYLAQIFDEPDGKFRLLVRAPSYALVAERHALPRDEYEFSGVGDWRIGDLPKSLRDLVEALIREFESGATVGAEAVDDVVDAEVVDDDEPDTSWTPVEARTLALRLMSVAELKRVLDSYSLPTKGSKEALVARVVAHEIEAGELNA